MFSDGRSRRLQIAILAMVGCFQFVTASRADEPSPSGDIFGDPPPALDPQKALVSFDALTPPVEIAPTEVAQDPLPDRPVWAMDRATELRNNNRYTEGVDPNWKKRGIAKNDRKNHSGAGANRLAVGRLQTGAQLCRRIAQNG
ncbi:MAG: hypothetical protein R3E58_20855 [Phycisphaerae bacterium]